jgi:hypothetical protein
MQQPQFTLQPSVAPLAQSEKLLARGTSRSRQRETLFEDDLFPNAPHLQTRKLGVGYEGTLLQIHVDLSAKE